MPATTQGFDYRILLRDELKKRQLKNPAYSLRSFALSTGFSAAYLSQIFSGKRVLTKTSGEKIARSLKWSSSEREFFLELIELSRSQNPETRAQVLKRVGKLQKLEFLELKHDEYEIVSEWYHFAILELMETKTFNPSPFSISRVLKISPVQVHDAIKRLIRVGLIEQKGKQLVKRNSHYRIGDVPSRAIQTFHKSRLDAAISALTEQKFEDRDFSGTTLSVDKSKLPEIKNLIREFRNSLNHYCVELGNQNSVYQLSVQFFRIDKDIS